MNITPKELKAKCEANFANFARLMQGPDWFDDAHQKLCDWVQYWIEKERETQSRTGDKIIKLGIIMPRGSLKSTIVTKLLSVWLAIKDPSTRILIATNTFPNARKKLNDIRGLFDTGDVFRALWPELLPTRDCKWTNEAAVINRPKDFPDATFESAGTGTVKTGSHFNVIIEDDTVAPDESNMKEDLALPSREELERSIGFHKAATPLLVPKGLRLRIVVTTRWGDDDLIEYIKKHEDYKLFDLPAVNSKGVRLFTSFYSEETLRDLESQVGPYMYSCLYLNKPIDASLRTFKNEWIEYITEAEIPKCDPQSGTLYPRFRTISIDPAISERDTACETAITEVVHVTMGTKSYQFWTRDIHGHLNPFEQVTKTLDLAQEHLSEVKCIIVETVAYQESLRYYFRDELIKRGLHIDITAMPTSRLKKDVRIEALVPYFANGRIKLVHTLTPQVETQLKQFPHGKLKDIIDAFSMHLKFQKSEGKETVVVPVKVEDENSAEAVLAQVRSNYNNRTGTQGILTEANKGRDFELCLTTGLGLAEDIQQALHGFTHIGRN